MNTTYAMTSTTLQRTFLAVSIALMCASVCVAQTPATPDAPPATPTTPAAGEAKPESPDAKGATPEGKGNQRRPRRPAVQPEAAAPAAPAEASPLAPLAWLEGCWSSNVNRRETREQWLPLRGNLMLGMSQTVLQGKTQDYEYLRIESRPEGIYYVALPSGQNATSFKYEGKTTETMGDRLLLIETLLPPGDTPMLGKLLDLEMLVICGGREREEAEYRALLAAAGFTYLRMIPTLAPLSILESR